MHDMKLTKIEFLSDENAIFTFYCPVCFAVIEINSQEDLVNMRVEGDTSVRHRGDSIINLQIEFIEATKERELINDLLEDVNLN